MGSVTGVGGSPYNSPNPSTPEEIKNAINNLTQAIEDISNGGTMPAELFQKCKDSLQAIANDPRMPKPWREDAKQMLTDLENSPGSSNAEQTLKNIVQKLQNMKL